MTERETILFPICQLSLGMKRQVSEFGSSPLFQSSILVIVKDTKNTIDFVLPLPLVGDGALAANHHGHYHDVDPGQNPVKLLLEQASLCHKDTAKAQKESIIIGAIRHKVRHPKHL